MSMMRAIVLHAPGGPEVLKVQQWKKPVPKAGQVLIRVKAFGLNRSEMFTRKGINPALGHVTLPIVLGIEAVGLVEEAPGNEFQKGDVVATCMGGMGRAYDGGHAEFTCVPADQVQVVKTKLPWEQLGALPEMMQTAWGSLFESLQLKKEDHLLIRGGTTSIGLAATALVKSMNLCASVASTTRQPEREAMLKEYGADEVFIDNGSIAEEVRIRRPEGYSKVLELIGVSTLVDSLKCVKAQGILCYTGVVGNKFTLDTFNPLSIPPSVCLTAYAGLGPARFQRTPLDKIAQAMLDGSLKFPIQTFHMDQIADAHRAMDENKTGAKIVVLVDA